jgi:hypothetical protein
MTRHELTQDELDSERGDLLPEREAMSLVNPDPSVYPLPDGDLPPLIDDTGGDTGGQASGAADRASGIAAEGSESRPESVTTADRSEQISQSDSARAET